MRIFNELAENWRFFKIKRNVFVLALSIHSDCIFNRRLNAIALSV
jgi:hypothetical protein